MDEPVGVFRARGDGAVTVVIVLAVIVLAAMAVAVVRFLVAYRADEGPMEECAGADLDGSQYRPCGRTLTARQAHVLVDTWDEGDGTGSGVSVAYCGRHCPGGCQRGCHARMSA